MLTLPAAIPSPYVITTPPPGGGSTDTGQYDILVGGLPFNLATSSDNPFVRRKVQATAQRIQQASEPGEATLTDWWRAAQSSFHAGAGQKYLDPAVESPVAKARYDTSFNVDPFTPGQVTRLPDTSTAYTMTYNGPIDVVTGYSGFDEYAVLASPYELVSLKFTNATLPAAATAIPAPVGVSGFSVASLCTDGASYYAGASWTIAAVQYQGVVRGSLSSAAAPTIIYQTATNSTQMNVGWAKGRLMAAYGRSVYELNAQAVGVNPLPTANFTHAATDWQGFGGFAESPTGILCAGTSGTKSDIVELVLVNVAGAPTLQGGSVVVTMPPAEIIYSMSTHSGTFLAIGTSRGVRIGSWSEYSSALKYGPLTVETKLPVLATVGRDRFVYATYTNGLAGGETGLACIDLSTQTDDAGRMAYAPSLPCPVTQTGTVSTVATLPLSQRLIFTVGDIAPQVIVEGVGAGFVRPAWLRTSRARMGTVEPKLFKLGRVRGTVSSAELSVAAYTPNASDEDATPLVTFTNLSTEPDEFRLPAGAREWIALRFDLAGAGCIFNSYVVSARPAPRWQWEYVATCILSETETGRQGAKIRPPGPRARLAAVQELVSKGEEVQLVEWDPGGNIMTLVTVEDAEFTQQSPPQKRTSFGGVLSFRLRTTEGP